MNAVDLVLSRLRDVKRSGDGWKAHCPVHDDRKASLGIKIGQDGRVLLRCYAGCRTEDIVKAVGLTMTDLFLQGAGVKVKPRIVAVYDYHDATGTLLFQCVRYEPKDFRQRRPDPDKPGECIWNLKGVPRVLYRLPELIAALDAGRPILVVEGEKDVDALQKKGFAATCNPLGAKIDGSSWLPDHTKALGQATAVVVIADKDKVGRGHASAVASALHGVVPTIKLIELPDRGGVTVKDSADFFAAGGSSGELEEIVAAAPTFAPTRESGKSTDLASGEENDSDVDHAPKPVPTSAATQLVELADPFVFFHDPQFRPLVRLEVNGHEEIWPVNSGHFRNLLASMFYKRARKAINRNALSDGIATLAGRACHDSPEEPVYLRVAPNDQNILIDLCDGQWRVLEVTPDGWSLLTKSPVAFIRTGSIRALPFPTPGGSITPLWDLLNVTEAQRPLVAGAVLNYFNPVGPYFVTNFVGEQGSAKSCAARILRMLVDPNEIPLRSPPREERDLLVQAASNWCVALDNLSHLSPWLSDALCRLATGGGHSARTLYTDLEEISVAIKRPVILNGIEDVAARPDLAERAVQIELETIFEDRRVSEKELWQRFEAARSVIFSGVLDGLVCALRELPKVSEETRLLPRMADPALWATAGETALGWPRGTFIAAYKQNLNEGASASLDANHVGVAIRQLLDKNDEWKGEAAELLSTLDELVPHELRRPKNWPETPRALSNCLRRLAPALRRSGIDIAFQKGKRRLIRLWNRGIPASSASPVGSEGDDGDAKDASLRLLYDENPAPSAPLIEELV